MLPISILGLMKSVETFTANSDSSEFAFTRVELLVVILTLALLALTLLPSLARTHVQSEGTQCRFNLRQLSLAWTMYTDDSNDKLAPNRGAFPPNPDYNAYPRWAAGDMRGGIIVPPSLDVTNASILIDPKYSLLGPYVKNPALFKCPADLSTWSGQPRVRSYSMNAAVGSAINGTVQDTGHSPVGHWLPSQPAGGPWRVYLKKSDLSGSLGPANLILLVDEHPDSINDAVFSFQMPINPANTVWIDAPTKVHNNAGNLSFADGHVETHQWQKPQVIPPLIWAADTAPSVGGQLSPVPQDPDILWMAHRMTSPALGAPPGLYQP
jgi:prepilin-type processing-associated H-X9-DG protein